MRTQPETRRETASPYSPAGAREALLFEALTCTITGRPLPEQLRPPAPQAPRPASAEEGLRWIVGGPR